MGTPIDISRPSLGQMLAIWGQALGRDVGPNSSFFLLEGTSMAATAIIGVLADRFGIVLDPREVLDAETPAALLRRIPITPRDE